MKKHYDHSEYYINKKSNFVDKKSKHNQYILKQVYSIYYPKKDEKIVDLGCGWGTISIDLLKKSFDVVGVDYSKQSIEICRKTAKKKGLVNARFICKDATNTGLKKDFYDVVYCSALVEHLYPEVYENLLKEVKSILKKDGKLIIYAPNPEHFFEFLKRKDIILKKDITHVDYKSMDRLKSSLKRMDFRIQKAIYMESHIPLLDFFERLFLKYVPLLRRRVAVLAIKR